MHLTFYFASNPINFIITFALLATAEHCFSCIALNIAVSRVHTILLSFQGDLSPLPQYHFSAKDKH